MGGTGTKISPTANEWADVGQLENLNLSPNPSFYLSYVSKTEICTQLLPNDNSEGTHSFRYDYYSGRALIDR